MKTTQPFPRDGSIVKYRHSSHAGVQDFPLTRHAIGLVIKGRKLIHEGDTSREIRAGELFYLSIGTHYIEDVPDSGRVFEQIVCYYEPAKLNRILNHLDTTYRIPLRNSHACDRCRGQKDVAFPAWDSVKHLFQLMSRYLKENLPERDPVTTDMLLTLLVHQMLLREDCCLNVRLFDGIDVRASDFTQIIHAHIFVDIPIEALAEKCGRSLTAFKKNFKTAFGDSPHRWFIRQRLMKARLLLISTGKSIAEIGAECTFTNTSHFIKLFRKEFGTTPVAYRWQWSNREAAAPPKPRVRAKSAPRTRVKIAEK